MTRHHFTSPIALAVLVAAFAAPAIAQTDAANPLQGIQVKEASDQTVVEIRAQSKPTFTVFKLADPPRLFVDVVGADVSALDASMNVSNGVVGRIHALQYAGDMGPVGRVVVEFERDASYDIDTDGSTIRLMVDGTARTRPDLRLKKAKAEAKRLEQAIAREKELLTDLEAARKEEERLREQAREARLREEKLQERVAAAREEAERSSERAKQEADKVTGQLRQLEEARELEKAKAEALSRAVRAEQARKKALEAERKKAADLKKATEEALAHEKARLAAMKAATKRAEDERAAAEAAAEAARQQEIAARRVEEAREAGREEKLAELKGELEHKDEALSQANAKLDETQAALEEARLAQAQAETRLRETNERKLALEKERRTAAEEALAQEKARTKALQEALERRRKGEAARKAKKLADASEQAQQRLAELESSLEAQREQVSEAQEQAEVEKARIALLEDQLEAERQKLAELRDEREAEETRLAGVRDEVRAVERTLADTRDKAKQAQARYERKLAALEAAERRETEDVAAREAEAARASEMADEARRAAEDQQERLEGLRSELARLEGRIDETRQKTAAADEAYREKQKAIAELDAEREAKERELAKVSERARQARDKTREGEPEAAGAKTDEVRSGAVVTDVAYDEDDQGSRVKIGLTRAADYEIVRRGPRRVELKLRGVTIPRKLERSLDASDYEGPIKLVSSFRSADEPGTVRVVVDLRERAGHDIREEDGALVWSFRPDAVASGRQVADRDGRGDSGDEGQPAGRMPPGVHSYPGQVAAQGGAVAGKAGASASRLMQNRRRRRSREYSGKKINLTIKDADIQHVLTFLAKEGGVNIVASEEVSGQVTFHLENIPWDLALDMVLKTQGYDYVRESGVYRVAPSDAIQQEFEQELRRKQTIEELKPMVVRFITVNYADLGDVSDHIKTVLSKNGTVSGDESTSTLIVKDTEEHVIAAEDIVRRLDVQLPQVLIEARIVEATSSFSRELGVQWGGNFTMSPAFGNPTGLAFPSVVGISGGADDQTAPTGGVLSTSPNFAVNLPAAAGAGAGGALGLTLGSLGGAANLNLRLSAAEDEGQVKIVSAPKILTLDGQVASINQGTSIPISVVSANGVNTQFFNAELKLEVQTNTSPDGNIRLDLDITKNEPNFGQTSAQGAPTIQKREAQTSLLVRDGETTVIGGIFTRNTGWSKSKVPFISKVPILGWFFQNKSQTDDRSELLIFITPRIANRRASLVGTGAE